MATNNELAQRVLEELKDGGNDVRSDDISKLEAYIKEGYDHVEAKAPERLSPHEYAALMAEKAVREYAKARRLGQMPDSTRNFKRAYNQWKDNAAREFYNEYSRIDDDNKLELDRTLDDTPGRYNTE